MLEREFQSRLIKKLRRMFPGAIILKNDTEYLQGISDLTLLWRRRWAVLEVKAYEGAPEQPNQAYYVDLANEMSFGAFIYPENEEEVLDDLQHTFGSGW